MTSTTAPASGADPKPGADVLARARAALGSGVGLAGVDLDAVPQQELRAWGEALGRMRRELDLMLAKVSSAQARRSTQADGPGGMARRNGKPSPRNLISGQTGGSEHDAGRLIDVGDMLDDARKAGEAPGAAAPPAGDEEPTQPVPGRDDGGAAPVVPAEAAGPRFHVLCEAVEAADVSIEAAALITRTLTSVWETTDRAVWLRAERELVAKATLLSLKQLSRVVRQMEANLDRSGVEQRERVQHAARYLHMSEDDAGMVSINGRLDIETAAPIKTVLDALVAKSLQAKRDRAGVTVDERTVPQMRADALAIVARHMIGVDDSVLPRSAVTVVVRTQAADAVDAIDAAGRGQTSDGVASVDGFGQPVSASTARRIAGDGTIVPVTLTADSAVLDLGRDRRSFTRDQRLALVERDGGCAMCGAPPSWCEAHHIRAWGEAGRTDLDNGLLLCTRCHHDLHRQGWLVDATPTQVWFTPPATIDPERRRRPGGRMLHNHVPLTAASLDALERAGRDATGAAASRRHSTTHAASPVDRTREDRRESSAAGPQPDVPGGHATHGGRESSAQGRPDAAGSASQGEHGTAGAQGRLLHRASAPCVVGRPEGRHGRSRRGRRDRERSALEDRVRRSLAAL
ncbi:HNH endonuclease signature motif containing protein [Demequina sp. NBRC 110053]|uniref:HNH endonuclease signature motif containing protein n=1 Tax=Demequina sp. NBRC 110053 TaxID=1570342 RepID=UPI000A039595|nr:HNH endonuclease signature motif containing protein [Demequina sp. NBRC 110053]